MLLNETQILRTDIAGKVYENKAVEYLINKGYKILERNFLCKLGEMDIIAEKDGRIIFVEVKERSSLRFGYGREAITKQKIRKLTNTALSYMKNYIRREMPMRFDLIEITNDEITHLEAII